MDMRPIHAAALLGDYAAVLRLARLGRGWTQTQLGRRANLSRTVVSRFETGDRALRDVELRRRLADALDLPVEIFGLYAPRGPRLAALSRRETMCTVARFWPPREPPCCRPDSHSPTQTPLLPPRFTR